ncbi:uncharacterized protein V6R79_016163 [Siganus canaliculatus]
MRSAFSLLSPPLSPPSTPIPLPISGLSLICCPELDLSVRLSPNQEQKKGGAKACDVEPVVLRIMPEPLVTVSALRQQPVEAQRRSTGRKLSQQSLTVPRQLVEPVVASNQDPSSLERAEPNTTLALKAELQSLQETEFNSHKAVQDILRISERTKSLINTRATEVTNIARSQLLFTSLVSVTVQKEQLINRVLPDTEIVPPTPCKAADGPSHLLFMTSELLRQKPVPAKEETVNAVPFPSAHHSHFTFDLHRRQMRHQVTP